MVYEEAMRPGHYWLGSMLWVSLSALTLLVGWQELHLTHEISCASNPHHFSSGTSSGRKCPVWAWGNPFPLTHSLLHFPVFYSIFYFSLFFILLALSIFLLVHPFPFYQNSPTPFPGFSFLCWFSVTCIFLVKDPFPFLGGCWTKRRPGLRLIYR